MVSVAFGNEEGTGAASVPAKSTTLFVKYPPSPATTATTTKLMMNIVLLIPPRLTICPGTLVMIDQRPNPEYCVINRPTDYTERLHRAGVHNSLSHSWSLTCH